MSPRDILCKASAPVYASGSLDGEQEKELETTEKTFPCSLGRLSDSCVFFC